MKTSAALKPFISVTLVLFTLLTVVFMKMEVRRVGYSLLKDTRQFKTMTETKRLQEMTLAQLVRPERIEGLAQRRLSLQKPIKGQIVQLSGQKIVLQN
jgi:hypothetical protein